jgi:tRNA(Ile)-lysidine synthase
VHALSKCVEGYIRRHKLLRAGDRVGVAVSGGADSVSLLRSLLELRKELGVVVSVVHFNHKLRGADADGDEAFVVELARTFRLDLFCETGDVAAQAGGNNSGIEATARAMRYHFFRKLLRDGRLDVVATAHTLDDQAETVLLRLARGAGTRGLAGIYPQLSVPDSPFPDARIVRPLLGIRRTEVEGYLREIGQGWREDGSNRDLRFARNRLRHGILPRLERALNPSVRESLAETAEIARAEEDYWEAEVAKVLPAIWETEQRTLKAERLNELPLALRRRVVREAAQTLGLQLEFAHVEEILEVVAGGEKSANLPSGWRAERRKNNLYLLARENGQSNADYAYDLPVPGRIAVPEAGVWFEAALIRKSAKAEYNRGNSLDPAMLSGKLQVRNWRAGDRFRPAHSKSPKKIKELLQKRHVTGRDRRLWPVVVCGDRVVWLRGFDAARQPQPNDSAVEMLVIQEFPMTSSV